MYQPHPMNSLHLRNTEVLINGKASRCTDNFTYLGSAVTNTNSSDLEIERHVQSASKAFGALQKHLWSHHDVKLCTKIKVYKTAIHPVLFYSTETMTLYWHDLRQLTRTQLQHLKAIMHIKWQERVPDVEVLKRAGTVSAEATITARQLRWAGLVSRMLDDRLPKAVFLGGIDLWQQEDRCSKTEVQNGLKQHLKNAGIDVHIWEDKAQDRSCWCDIVSKFLIAIEERHLQQYNIAHNKRHSQLVTSDFICSRCHWACHSKAGLTLHNQAWKDYILFSSHFHDTDAPKPVIIENNGLSIYIWINNPYVLLLCLCFFLLIL